MPENPFLARLDEVLAIASQGVGKSTSTTTSRIALAHAGQDGVAAARRGRVGILDCLDARDSRSPPELDEDKAIIPPEAHGVRLISMGFFVRENQAVIWRGPMLPQGARAVHHRRESGASPTTSSSTCRPGPVTCPSPCRSFLPRAEVIVVTTPQVAGAVRRPACRRHVREGGGLDLIGVIENMKLVSAADDGKAYEIFGSGRWPGAGRPPRGTAARQVPLVTELREGGDTGARSFVNRARLRGRGRLPPDRGAESRRSSARQDLQERELRLM